MKQPLVTPNALKVAAFAGALFSGLLLQPSHAADVVKADNANNLNLTTSWSGGTSPTASDVAVWDSTVTSANTTLLGADLSWGGIRVAGPAGPVVINLGNFLTNGASGIDLGSALQDLTLNNWLSVGASQTWNVGAGRTLTISTPLVGTAGTYITKSGSGTLALSATVNSNYAGNISIDGGTLSLNSGNANNNSSLGTGVITNNGATLRAAAARIIGNVVQFNGTCVLDANSVSVPFDGAWQGSGTVLISNLVSGQTLTAGGNGNGSGTWANFTGTVLLGNNSGTFRFNNGGGNNNAGNVGATIDLGIGNTTLTVRNRLGTTIHIGTLKGGPNTRISIGSNGTGGTIYSVGALNVNSEFAGAITGDVGTTFLALTKVGSATLTLTGTNTHIGPTTVSAGTLQVGNGGIIGQLGSGTIVNNASLVYNRSDAVTISNAISGSGNLTLQGGIIATFEGTNNSSGTLVVSSGAADVGAGGWIQCPISLGSGTALIVTNNPIFTLNQTLSGSGKVDGAITAIGGIIAPGGSSAGGTLNFAGALTETGNVVHQLELATAGPSDLISITGDLNVSGTNSIVATKLGGGTLALGTYPLVNYTGTLNGGLSNFAVTVVGVIGTLTNPPNQIALIVTPAARSFTNLTWVGDGSANYWDNDLSQNWVNSGNPFKFLAGDSVRFDATGAANPIVTLNSTVLQPAATVVDASSSYTFTGIGSISGGGLTKNNSGTLIVQTTNNYPGPTVVNGGVLEIGSVANGNSASPIGASSSHPTNLVLNNATLRFTDTGATDRGITVSGTSANFDITTGNLTLNGSQVVGSGALVKSGGGTLTLMIPNAYTGGTVLSNGILALGANSANSDGAGGSGIGATNNVVTFRGGTLQLFGYNGGTGNNFNTCYNPLVVPAGETGTLQMFPRGPANSGGNAGLQSSLSGAGTLNLVVNYVRDDLSGNWSAFTGLINATAKNGADEMRINNNFGYSNATINLNDGVTLCRSFSADTVNDIGVLTGTSLAVVGPGNSSGARTTWRVGSLNTDATFAGTFADDAGSTALKVGTGTWTLSGAVSVGNLVVSNGVVAATSSLTSTNIRVAAGAFLDVTAQPSSTLALATGQTLGGNGTVRGAVDCSLGGNIAPGFSIGTLTVTNTVVLGGNTIMEVNRSGFVSDKLGAPSIIFGGTLVLKNAGATLQVGDTFDLLDGSLSGTFASIYGGYYTWNTANLAVNGTVTVTGLLPHPTLSATATPTDIVLAAAGGIPGGPLAIVTATDVATPLSSWTVVQSDVFDPSGNYSASIPIDVNSPKRFYAIRAE